MAHIQERHRREAVAIYDGTVEIFGKPVKVDVDRWSPASLKELASEALRRKIFVDEWVDAGGLARFARDDMSKFDAAVLRRVSEEDFIGFRTRIKTWLDTNPRPQFPQLPESIPWDESSSVSVGSLGAPDTWSIEDVVKNHRYYIMSPDRSGTSGAAGASGNPASNEADSSVEILQIKKKPKN